LRERYGEKVRTPLVEPKRGLLTRWLPGNSAIAALARPGLGDDLLSTLESRALWSRYGL
jgi:hypothetical protein